MISYNTRLLYLMKLLGDISMWYRVVMKTPVDGKLLNEAAQEAMIRYPYLGKKIVIENGTYVYKENHAPVPVVEGTKNLPKYGSEEANEHLILLNYDGRAIYFNMSHCLSAGRGFARWVYSVLYAYEKRISGKEPDCPKIRRPDVPPEPGEDFLEPFSGLPENAPAFKGFGPDINPIPPSKLEELIGAGVGDGLYVTLIKLDGKEVMSKVKACGASPATYFGALYYKSFLSMMKEAPDCFNLATACDSSDELGLSKTMSLITRFLSFPITKAESGLSVGELAAKGRALIKEQMDPSLMADILKREEKVLVEMEALPTISEKAAYYAMNNAAVGLTPTTLVSYVGRIDLEGLDNVECWEEGGATGKRGLLVISPENKFHLILHHTVSENDKTVASMVDELKKEGLAPEVVHTLPQNHIGLVFPEE